jgi:UDPglucose 6-dehydrogenase
MKVGLIGKGFVGGALYNTFIKSINVEVFDLDKSKRTVNSLKDLSSKCEIIFLALPTPMQENGSIDLDPIESNLSVLNSYNVLFNIHNIIVIKSSLPPGKTEYLQSKYNRLHFVFNPEFLTERNADEDFKNQTKVILGGKHEDLIKVGEVYKTCLPKAQIHFTDTTSAEMVKFIVNCFLSTKVSFFNEMYQVCNKLNINYDDVLKMSLLDERIGSSHTKVPGHDGSVGFSGSCFPANVNIMIDEMTKLGIQPTVLKAVWSKNKEVRPEQDWNKLEGRAVSKSKK